MKDPFPYGFAFYRMFCDICDIYGDHPRIIPRYANSPLLRAITLLDVVKISESIVSDRGEELNFFVFDVLFKIMRRIL